MLLLEGLRPVPLCSRVTMLHETSALDFACNGRILEPILRLKQSELQENSAETCPVITGVAFFCCRRNCASAKKLRESRTLRRLMRGAWGQKSGGSSPPMSRGYCCFRSTLILIYFALTCSQNPALDFACQAHIVEAMLAAIWGISRTQQKRPARFWTGRDSQVSLDPLNQIEVRQGSKIAEQACAPITCH